MLPDSESKQVFFPADSGSDVFATSIALRHTGVVVKLAFEVVVEEGALVFGGAGAEPHLNVLGQVLSLVLACRGSTV